jgi:hypothetical protein
MPRDQLFAVRIGALPIALVASSCAQIAIKIAAHMTGEPADRLSAAPASADQRWEFTRSEYAQRHAAPPLCLVLPRVGETAEACAA